MTKIFNFPLKIKGGGREGGTCEVLRPCHPPKKNLERAQALVSHFISGFEIGYHQFYQSTIMSLVV